MIPSRESADTYHTAQNKSGKRVHAQKRPCQSKSSSKKGTPPVSVPERSEWEHQIAGFTSCLMGWIARHFYTVFFKSTLRRRQVKRSITNHLRKIFEGVKLESLPKMFKLHLCTYFSIGNNQEVPPGGEDVVFLSLFPEETGITVTRKELGKLIPSCHIRKVIADECLASNYKRRLLLWDLMQCKSLSNPVPDVFVSEAYAKHKATVTKRARTPPSLVKEFLDFCEEWVADVESEYRDKTYLAKSASYYDCSLDPKLGFESTPDFQEWSSEFYQSSFRQTARSAKIANDDVSWDPKIEKNFTRSRGGCHSAILNCQRTSSSLWVNKDSTVSEPRMEPVSTILCGAPGIGKSTIVNSVCRLLSEKHFASDWKGRCFFRNETCEHWDGYNPDKHFITCVDDWFMRVGKCNNEPFSEFISTISTAPYQPPMADLKNKGKSFTSDYFLGSTNNGHLVAGLPRPVDGITDCIPDPGHVNLVLSAFVTNPEAIVRRMKGSLYIGQVKDRFLNKNSSGRHFYLWRFDGKSFQRFGPREPIPYMRVCELITDYLYNRWVVSRKNFYELHKSYRLDWAQEVMKTQEGVTLSYTFPSYPPPGPAYVKTAAVLEPLKVRMITKTHPYSWSLKPLQRTMFNCLRKYPCFEPCFTPEYDLRSLLVRSLGKRKNGYSFTSIDYVGATDNINLDISQALYHKLAARLETRFPQVSRSLLWETQPKYVVYPEHKFVQDGKIHKVKLDCVLQTHGQFMGSLMSFPLLCLLNAFLACKATKTESLHELKAAIHGDDACALLKDTEHNTWMRLGPEVGLSFSVGKTYRSRNFVSIDSRIYSTTCIAQPRKLTLLRTGKYTAAVRTSPKSSLTPEVVSIAIEQGGFDPKVISIINSQPLSRCVRSTAVPRTHGGLGKAWGSPLVGETQRLNKNPEDWQKMKLIYLTDLVRTMETQFFRAGERLICRLPKVLLDSFSINGRSVCLDLFSEMRRRIYDDPEVAQDRYRVQLLKLQRLTFKTYNRYLRLAPGPVREVMIDGLEKLYSFDSLKDYPELNHYDLVSIDLTGISPVTIQCLQILLVLKDTFGDTKSLDVLRPFWLPLLRKSIFGLGASVALPDVVWPSDHLSLYQKLRSEAFGRVSLQKAQELLNNSVEDILQLEVESESSSEENYDDFLRLEEQFICTKEVEQLITNLSPAEIASDLKAGYVRIACRRGRTISKAGRVDKNGTLFPKQQSLSLEHSSESLDLSSYSGSCSLE